MSSQHISNLSIIVLLFGTLISIALTICIAVVFTLGVARTSPHRENGDERESVYLVKPCECGCPSIRGSWPWQMLLIQYDQMNSPEGYCGGSLITREHVLTAAHCVKGYSPGKIGIIPSVHEFNEDDWPQSSLYIADQIYIHESYDDRRLTDDIAIIRLRKSIEFNENVSRVCLSSAHLSNEPLREGHVLIATGCRLIHFGNQTKSRELDQTRLEYIPEEHSQCITLKNGSENERAGQMCAYLQSTPLSHGNSGGPLVRSLIHPNGKIFYEQVGMMCDNFRQSALTTNYSDLFTRVSYYEKWIHLRTQITL